MATSKEVKDWLRRSKDLACTHEALQILMRCQKREDILFAAGFLMTRGWYCVKDQHFENQLYQLKPGAMVAGYRVDFLLSSRHHPERSTAFDLVDDSPQVASSPADMRRAGAIAATMPYKPTPFSMISRVAHEVHTLLLAETKRYPRYSTTNYALLSDVGLMWVRLRDGFTLAGLSMRARIARLRGWLAEQEITLPLHLLPILARCETHAEIKFLLPILRGVPWKAQRSDTSMPGTPIDRIMNGQQGVHIQFPLGAHRVDFLIGRPGSSTRRATAIDVVRTPAPHERDTTALYRENEAAARAAGYRYLAIRESDSEAEGRSWANILQDDVDDASNHRGSATDAADLSR